jgi:hypothetical protein
VSACGSTMSPILARMSPRLRSRCVNRRFSSIASGGSVLALIFLSMRESYQI